MDAIARLRDICLRLPEAWEKETWDTPTFRVGNKMFAISGVAEDGVRRVTLKAAPGEQALLLAAGDHFYYPSYVGPKGWIGVVLDPDTDWGEIAELVEDSYRLIAPRRLVSKLDA